MTEAITETRKSAIAVKTVATPRLHVSVRTAGAETGIPVVFVHGNCSSAAFFDGLLASLPSSFYGVAPDLRGYGDTEPVAIDATRGLRDFSDDVWATLVAMGLVGDGKKVHLMGHSVGGGVIQQLAIDHPEAVASLVLEAPVSPYGFGGTKDVDGTPCFSDFAGSGGGTAAPPFVQGLKEKDRGESHDAAPRKVFNALYVKPPFRAPDEEALLTSMLTTRVGDGFYPGDMTTSENWPSVAPGKTGMNNAISPRYLNLSPFADIDPKPPVLWIRGDSDQIVSDTSALDFGFLGSLGAVPGWPGADVYPPQPMVSQTRKVLGNYKANGGSVEEVVYEDCGHSPHIEKADEVARRVFAFFAAHAAR